MGFIGVYTEFKLISQTDVDFVSCFHKDLDFIIPGLYKGFTRVFARAFTRATVSIGVLYFIAGFGSCFGRWPRFRA